MNDTLRSTNIFAIRMSNLIHQAVRKLSSPLLSFRGRLHLERALGNKERTVKAVGNAISKQLSGFTLPQEEQRLFNEVEAYRSRLLASTEQIDVLDFGAGSPTAGLSWEQMAKGTRTQLSVASIARSASSPQQWGQLMFRLIQELRPKVCLELGTSLGISAAYQAAGHRTNGNGITHTIEGSPSIAAFAEHNLRTLGAKEVTVHCGRFMDVLPDLLPKIGLLDLVFIDGHHDHRATLEYFDLIAPHLSSNAVVIFDDIRWSSGMRAAWRQLCEDPRTGTCFDLERWGICCTGTQRSGDQPAYKIVYHNAKQITKVP